MITTRTIRLDEETGQLLETQTTVAVRSKVDPFYIVFPEAGERMLYLNSYRAMQLFYLYCVHLRYEDNIVDLSAYENQEIQNRLGIDYTYRWKMTAKLIEVGLMHRLEDGRLEINPKAVWKGNLAKRRDFLKSKHHEYLTKYVSLETLKQTK